MAKTTARKAGGAVSARGNSGRAASGGKTGDKTGNKNGGETGGRSASASSASARSSGKSKGRKSTSRSSVSSAATGRSARENAAETGSTRRSGAMGASGGGRSAASRSGGGGGGKRKLNPALARPVTPDEELAQIVGAEPLPRPQVVKKIWDYIKAEGLQDTQNKRLINADEKLRRVFDGKKKVNMFEMTKLVSAHIQ